MGLRPGRPRDRPLVREADTDLYRPLCPGNNQPPPLLGRLWMASPSSVELPHNNITTNKTFTKVTAVLGGGKGGMDIIPNFNYVIFDQTPTIARNVFLLLNGSYL